MSKYRFLCNWMQILVSGFQIRRRLMWKKALPFYKELVTAASGGRLVWKPDFLYLGGGSMSLGTAFPEPTPGVSVWWWGGSSRLVIHPGLCQFKCVPRETPGKFKDGLGGTWREAGFTGVFGVIFRSWAQAWQPFLREKKGPVVLHESCQYQLLCKPE